MTPNMAAIKGNPNHWAFQEGAAAGREGNTTRRGLMGFGLSCAATSVDAENTRQWLAGFDATVLQKESPSTMQEWRDATLEPVHGCGHMQGRGAA